MVGSDGRVRAQHARHVRRYWTDWSCFFITEPASASRASEQANIKRGWSACCCSSKHTRSVEQSSWLWRETVHLRAALDVQRRNRARSKVDVSVCCCAGSQRLVSTRQTPGFFSFLVRPHVKSPASLQRKIPTPIRGRSGGCAREETPRLARPISLHQSCSEEDSEKEGNN